MPNLQALMASGTTYDRAWVGQIASETPTGHATLGTGTFPRRHGILGFEWRDGQTRKEVLDGWIPGVEQGLLDRDLRRSGTNSISRTVRGADHNALVVAISSEKPYAADAIGGPAANYVFFHQFDKRDATVTPRSLTGHQALPASYLKDPRIAGRYPMSDFGEWDALSAQLAVKAVRRLRPKVLMVNLPGADVYGHPYGGPASPAVMGTVMKGVDRSIGKIVNAYKRAGILGQTLFLIVGDHGMVPNTHVVSLDDVSRAVARAGATLLFQTGGTAKFVYLRHSGKAAAVAAELSSLRAVAAAYHLTTSAGKYAYIQAGETKIGAPLQAAHDYLLDTFASERAPDVIAAFRENTIGRAMPTLYGYHGGLNWGAQTIPLILSGPGVKAGQTSHYPARLVDLAPTLLALLGMQATDMDGMVLADALTAPGSTDITAQAALEPALVGYQDALMTQSAQDIAQDQAGDIGPPPRAPVHPYWVGTCCGSCGEAADVGS
jgi:predicted AlkP superfamily pyrophosphatase or phosphodiesterase